MEELRYPLECNGSLNRWRTGGLQKKPFPSPCEAFDAPVNYGEAYVQIVYPVRKAFLGQYDPARIAAPEGPFPEVYFPFERNRIDFSSFFRTPHHLWVEGVSWIYASEAGEYPFEAYTCGGVIVWAEGREVLRFAPFTRNIPGKTETRLPLKRGLNELRVYADELAERDVFFYFELRYKGRVPLEGVLLVDRGAEEIRRAEEFLTSCYFPKDSLSEGDIVLRYDPDALDADRELFVRFDPGSDEFRVWARKDRDSVDIAPVRRWVGLYKVRAGVEAGGMRINRELVLGLRSTELTSLDAQGGIRDRKQRAMAFIMNHGEREVNRAMVICEVQRTLTPTAEGFLRQSLACIDDMEDCADFHLVPLLLFMVRYKKLLPADMGEEIKRLILKFRYWIDEPGNDVMWYFSENHAFLFHVSQYLAGCLFPEDVFSASGRTGAEQSAIGRKRVEGWFTAFFRWGFAEWNSATYIPIDLLGFFVLYETAQDETIRALSKAALDYAFKIIAYNSFNGVMSCSYGRAYEHTLKSREQVETSFLEWIACGSGYVNSRTRSAALFSLSAYEPPPYNQEVLLGGTDWMSLEFDQGMNQVKTYSYRTADFFSASVRRFKPFRHGHQQHLMNIALGRQAVQFYINHPGEPAFSGENRPSYWAGNGTIPFIEQYRGLSLMIFNIDPEELVRYIHGYTTFYDYDEYNAAGQWLFFRCDRAFCGVWWSNGYEIVRTGANAGKEVISRGLNHGVILRCAGASEWVSFNAFCSDMKSAEVSYNGERAVLFRDPRYGLCSVNAPDSIILNGAELEYRAAPEMRIERGRF